MSMGITWLYVYEYMKIKYDNMSQVFMLLISSEALTMLVSLD